MEFAQLIILALIQGITEFLPISSSAHLILVPFLKAWQDQGLTIDVAAHLGSIFAVLVYFRKEIRRILIAGSKSIANGNFNAPDAQLFRLLIIASIPILVTGYLLRDIIAGYLRDPLIIAATSIIFGLLLWFADISGSRVRQMDSISVRDAIIIGLAQTLALVPGTSRSGITITAALMLGFDRGNAARLSFLMAVPIILAAGGYEALQLSQTDAVVNPVNFIGTAALSAVSAFLTIHYFLKFLDKIGMLPFVIYRIVLGIVLLLVFS